MTLKNDAVRPHKVAIYNLTNDVFETITDMFVDGTDLDGEGWERQYPSLNALRDQAYQVKERLYAELWPGWSYDEAEATGELNPMVGRASSIDSPNLRTFKLVVFAAINMATLRITGYFLDVAGESNWEDVDGELDDFRSQLLEQEEALFAELWPGRSWKEVVDAGDLK